jgi:hypothetical protein
MCQRSANKTANFLMNVAESLGCFFMNVASHIAYQILGGDNGHDRSDSVASDGSAHHLPGLWALPLTTFSDHGTFSLPSKLRLAERV